MYTLQNYLNTTTKAAPLAVFRVFFGLMMMLSVIRFWAYGWINKLYIQPDFFFSYWGFEWVKPLGAWTYLLFFVCGLSALFVALGFRYRLSILTFFFSFTYIELMDKTTYLNHYYFISLLSFVMIFLPAGKYFSIDASKHGSYEQVPRWSIDTIKLMLSIVYFYAGLAKLNSDWLVHAMPLKIWLPSKYGVPFLGDLLHKEWLIYFFSWAGAMYDLMIPFLLWARRTRIVAFSLVVVFHVLTRILFPIGMFPYIMIVSALIFFETTFHERVVKAISSLFSLNPARNLGAFMPTKNKLIAGFLSVFLFIQVLLPWRYLLYPGELFWTEEGFRFSWRVMLMEKAGYAQFSIYSPVHDKIFAVDNADFLTPFQEKQMSFQPDFILEFAHYLAEHFENQGHGDVEVYVESYVALNGRKSERYVDPTVNLAAIQPSFKHKTWILPFKDEIKGL